MGVNILTSVPRTLHPLAGETEGKRYVYRTRYDGPYVFYHRKDLAGMKPIYAVRFRMKLSVNT